MSIDCLKYISIVDFCDWASRVLTDIEQTIQWYWIKHLNASSQCSNHPTLSLVVRIKHLNAPSQWSRIFNPSTGSVQEENIAITMSWFSLYIYSPQEGRRKQPFIKERWYLPVKIPSSKFVSVLWVQPDMSWCRLQPEREPWRQRRGGSGEQGAGELYCAASGNLRPLVCGLQPRHLSLVRDKRNLI